MNVFFNYFYQRIYLVELIISANDITNMYLNRKFNLA